MIAGSLAAGLIIPAFAAESEAGYVDVGQLVPSAKGQFVEINLSPGLLKFAAKLASKQEPEAAAIIGNLKRVRVNVVGLDESNRQATIEQIKAVRAKLESQGWTPMVMVREKDDGNNVTIHAMQKSDDVIEGLVVTVIDRQGEAVFINIVGRISAEQIATVAEQLELEPLKHVKVKMRKQHKDADSAQDEA